MGGDFFAEGNGYEFVDLIAWVREMFKVKKFAMISCHSTVGGTDLTAEVHSLHKWSWHGARHVTDE